MKKVFFLVFIFSVNAGTLTSNSLEEYLNQYALENNFHGVIAVKKDNRILFAKPYGLANVEFNIPNSIDSKFRIGSLTKQFTATSILILQQQQKININDPVSKYLPAAPPEWRDITIKSLLTHSAGLIRSAPIATKDHSVAHSIAQIMDSIFKEPLSYKPGKRSVYSNVGYSVLAAIIEKASGLSYSVFLSKYIFEPSDLQDTGVDHDSIVLSKRSKDYLYDIDKNKLFAACCLDLTNSVGAGDVYSTVKDLLKWIDVLHTDRILNQDSKSLMFYPHILQSDDFYGFGWVVGQWKGKKLIWHNGSINGYSSDLAIFPDDNVTIVILSNRAILPKELNLEKLRYGISERILK